VTLIDAVRQRVNGAPIDLVHRERGRADRASCIKRPAWTSGYFGCERSMSFTHRSTQGRSGGSRACGGQIEASTTRARFMKSTREDYERVIGPFPKEALWR
jgi:hypothetical protein